MIFLFKIFLKVASNVNDGEIQRHFDEATAQPNVANRYQQCYSSTLSECFVTVVPKHCEGLLGQ